MLKRLSIAYLPWSLTAIAFIGGLSSWNALVDHRRQLTEEVIRRTALVAQAAGPLLQTADDSERQALARSLGGAAGGRLEMFDATGKKRADSAVVGPMVPTGSLSDEEGFAEAEQMGVYLDVVNPGDKGGPFTRLTRRIDEGPVIRFLRLSQSLSGEATGRLQVILLSWIAAAVGLIVIGWQMHHAERERHRLLGDLETAAKAVENGAYDQPIGDLDDDALGLFSRTFKHMRGKIKHDISVIERQRRNLQTILRTIPEGVVALDSDQRIVFANPSFHRLFGLASDDVTDRKLWEIVRQPGLQNAILASNRSNEPYSTDLEILDPPKSISLRARRMPMESGVGTIVVLHDVTELRRLERLRHEFFANVSHELKTPLAAIKAFTETLLTDELADRELAIRYLGRIEDQAERLHALVIDMLTLARVESQEQLFDIGPVNLQECVLACVDSFADEAAAKEIILTTRFNPYAEWVEADAEGVSTILNNLVDNAIKYTPRGGRVEVATRGDQQGMVTVTVSDTGVGIPSKDLGRVFERFYRVDKARSRAMGGTGLGLAIVKHLVKTFGGSIAVTSRLEQGTTFTMSLPASHRESLV